jgi:NAD-specific glutamate dehydrogenase
MNRVKTLINQNYEMIGDLKIILRETQIQV